MFFGSILNIYASVLIFFDLVFNIYSVIPVLNSILITYDGALVF